MNSHYDALRHLLVQWRASKQLLSERIVELSGAARSVSAGLDTIYTDRAAAVRIMETEIMDAAADIARYVRAADHDHDMAAKVLIVDTKEADCFERHNKSDPQIRRRVLALTNGHCAYCNIKLNDGGQAADSFVVEHVVPASCGGPDHLANYVPACQACNISKRDGHVLEFIKRRTAGDVVPLRPATATIGEAS